MKQPPVPFLTLLSQLSDPSSQVRKEAITSMMRWRSTRSQALAPLLTLLSDPDAQVCQTAISALGKLADTRSFPALTQLLISAHLPRTRSLALKALVQLDSTQAMPHVLAALQDQSALVRRTAVAIVGQEKYPQAVEPLVALLAGADWHLRSYAADALIDVAQPALNGPVNGYVGVEVDGDEVHYKRDIHEDSCGHGTACVGIIRSLAPECDIYSVKVPGKGLIGRGATFIAGLRWAIENDNAAD